MSRFALGLLVVSLFCLGIVGIAAAIPANDPLYSSASLLPTPYPTPRADLDPEAALADGSVEALSAFLRSVPIMPVFDDHSREIFAQGQELGNAPDVFTVVGDCNSESRAYLFPIDEGNYDLGPYNELQETVDAFAGSFGRNSIAAEVGFNALSVLDWGFADPRVCEDRESPLACELRRTRPAAVLIMFGANDIRYLTTEQHVEGMRQIIETALEQGIIPIVSTFTWCDGAEAEQKALELNVWDVRLAWEYDLPLMNFWLAAHELPSCGLITETHLTSSGEPGAAPFVTFANGEEREAGYSLRNLLTLQMLDDLRREVLP